MLYDRVADLPLWISERRLLVPDAQPVRLRSGLYRYNTEWSTPRNVLGWGRATGRHGPAHTGGPGRRPASKDGAPTGRPTPPRRRRPCDLPALWGGDGGRPSALHPPADGTPQEHTRGDSAPGVIANDRGVRPAAVLSAGHGTITSRPFSQLNVRNSHLLLQTSRQTGGFPLLSSVSGVQQVRVILSSCSLVTCYGICITIFGQEHW